MRPAEIAKASSSESADINLESRRSNKEQPEVYKSPHDSRIAVKREGTRAFNQDIHDLATMAFGTVEDDDFVAARAAHHAGSIFLAGAFDENLHARADKFLIAARRD